MQDYKTIDKTDWFIRKMRSGWFSRHEIVKLAATEFPSVPWKTLDGTIGQYWSDSVNPKWSTYQAIRARGLKIAESDGYRKIVEDGGISASPPGVYTVSARDAVATGQPTLSSARELPRGKEGNALSPLPQSFVNRTRYLKEHATVFGPTGKPRGTCEMWNGNDRALWEGALRRYWEFIKPANLQLEGEMDKLDAEAVKAMDEFAWYRFLLDRYFRWKYTAANRYASTTQKLRTYESNSELQILYQIKKRLFELNKDDIRQCLECATSIRGLGTAGASGLLAVLFPEKFGTVDQFVVKALAQIPELQESALIAAMNPEFLKPKDGVILISIMRRKAAELNRIFSTSVWTPRKVDMVLWTCAR